MQARLSVFSGVPGLSGDMPLTLHTLGVIPGRREAASPESIATGRGLWIPGSLASLGPRNDGNKCVAVGFQALPAALALPSKHAADALCDLGHDLCRDRFDLLVRHGLFARLQGHRDGDRFLVRINAGALVHIEYRDGGDQLAVGAPGGAYEIAGLHSAI